MSTNDTMIAKDDAIDLKKILTKLLDKWLWFVISIAICLTIAVIYSRYTAPNYQINAKLLVNDDEKGGGLGKDVGALMDLGGIMGSKNSVDNEVEILKTRFLMEQVVRELKLNIIYSRKSNLVSRELYKAPFQVNILKSLDTIQFVKLDVKKVTASMINEFLK